METLTIFIYQMDKPIQHRNHKLKEMIENISEQS